jgi:hypothetical protein
MDQKPDLLVRQVVWLPFNAVAEGTVSGRLKTYYRTLMMFLFCRYQPASTSSATPRSAQ